MIRYPYGYMGWAEVHPGDVPAADQAAHGPGPGDRFPPCRLDFAGGAAERGYLGLDGGTTAISLAELPAEYLLVEFYNSKCSTCVGEVSTYNAFHRRVESDPALAGRIKVVGVGVWDGRADVLAFGRESGVVMPLFSDVDGEIFGCLGQAVLPVSYLLRRDRRGGRVIIMVNPGRISNAPDFFRHLREAVVRPDPLP